MIVLTLVNGINRSVLDCPFLFTIVSQQSRKASRVHTRAIRPYEVRHFQLKSSGTKKCSELDDGLSRRRWHSHADNV